MATVSSGQAGPTAGPGTSAQPGAAAQAGTAVPGAAAGRLERIWIKRAHRGPMDAADRATLVAGRGVANSADQGGKRQVTIIARERWDAVIERHGTAVDPKVRRANLLISGIDLEKTRGRTLRIGACRILLRGETRPCERMDEASPGLRSALDLHWGGGAFGEVLDTGEIVVGDAVSWDEQPSLF